MERVGQLLERFGFAVVWATLPFTLGPALGSALDPLDTPIRTTASLGAWAGWAVALVAALTPRTTTLTAMRIIAPASLAVALWATVASDDRGGAQAVGIVFGFIAAMAALLPTTTDFFVNGSSYGDERRLALRPPGLLMLGPIELTWLAVVVGAAAGPLMLAARMWIPGALATVVGWAVAVAGMRSIHMLAQRWVVFVPAGMVLVDRLTLADALLMQRKSITSLGPALADTTARDLTAGASGLALQIDFGEEMSIVPIAPRRLRGPKPTTEVVSVASVIFTPSRPGTVLAEARARRLPVS